MNKRLFNVLIDITLLRYEGVDTYIIERSKSSPRKLSDASSINVPFRFYSCISPSMHVIAEQVVNAIGGGQCPVQIDIAGDGNIALSDFKAYMKWARQSGQANWKKKTNNNESKQEEVHSEDVERVQTGQTAIGISARFPAVNQLRN